MKFSFLRVVCTLSHADAFLHNLISITSSSIPSVHCPCVSFAKMKRVVGLVNIFVCFHDESECPSLWLYIAPRAPKFLIMAFSKTLDARTGPTTYESFHPRDSETRCVNTVRCAKRIQKKGEKGNNETAHRKRLSLPLVQILALFIANNHSNCS